MRSTGTNTEVGENNVYIHIHTYFLLLKRIIAVLTPAALQLKPVTWRPPALKKPESQQVVLSRPPAELHPQLVFTAVLFAALFSAFLRP